MYAHARVFVFGCVCMHVYACHVHNFIEGDIKRFSLFVKLLFILNSYVV